MITDRLRVLALRLMANFTFLLTACDGDNASAEGCQSDGATTSIPSAQPTRAAQGLSSRKTFASCFNDDWPRAIRSSPKEAAMIVGGIQNCSHIARDRRLGVTKSEIGA
jgi:hypothetical protein